MAKIFINECFGETLEFAESLGWQENQELSEQEWNCEVADGLEYDALDFIKQKGYTIIDPE